MNDHHAFANAVLLEKLSQLSSAPYQRHSATSKAAAKAIEPVAGTQRGRMLAQIKEFGFFGMTDQDFSRICFLPGDSVRPRRGELLKAGLIVNSGRTRKTPKGRDAVVWVAVEHQTKENF